MGGCVQSYPMIVPNHVQSASTEPRYQTPSVQDAHYQTDCVSNQVRGLVCHNRSQGCILPHIHPSSTLEVTEVCFWGEAYQYRVLPFGLSLSPHTFTKCADAALAPLRLQGIRILNYIDDWLILAQSEQMAAWHRDGVLPHMKELGLRLSAKKIVLSLLQRTTFLSVVWDSTTMQARRLKYVSENGNAQPNPRANQFKGKKKPSIILGTCAGGSIQVVKTKLVSVFATRFSPDLDSETLANYLKDKLQREVICQKMDTTQNRYSSFKVTAECDKVGDMYEPQLWPDGVFVR